MKRVVKLSFVALLFFISIMHFAFAGDVSIAVSANVSYAIKPLQHAFEVLHPETKVNVILGSSGKLSAQIKHGAPYDMFLSADMKYPQNLYEDHLTLAVPVVYAQGALAILSDEARDFSKGIALLSDGSIEKIAMANPKTAPYGAAAKEALEHVKLYEKLKEKFVYGESISQTVIYATTAADVGIVAKSSLYAPQMQRYQKGIQWKEVNASLYRPIEQGMVILKSARDKQEAKDFYNFILSGKSKEILTSYGYKVP